MSITQCYELSAEYHRAAFTAAGVPLALLDCEGRVLEANLALRAMLGDEPPLAAVTEGDAVAKRAFGELLRGERDRVRYTRGFKHRDGSAAWARVTLTPVPDPDDPDGGTHCALLAAEDVTEPYELRQRLRYVRMHDPLTRLPNRELFFERLSEALREASDGGRIGVCHLDVDGFKAVNDTLGHRVGDRLLTAVANRLARSTEPMGHLVARLGGDEFAVLIEESRDTSQATAVAETVLGALDIPFDIEGQRLAVSASVGVVERSVTGTTATEIMQAADTTLYWAKADGKARWSLYDPERSAHRMTRLALSSTLRPAVQRGEFELDYQPLVGIDDGRLRGVEALVRWRHPDLGVLAPNQFVCLAEENGAIVPLGRWVLTQACRQARRWQLDHPDSPPFVSVNVAVRQVWDSDLVADVAAVLERTGLPPAMLQLELTESAVMGSAGRPLQALHALSQMGVRIAIDDFGTGYSNLAYLSRLPVRALKLAGPFVHGFGEQAPPNPADETIVTALVRLAHQLDLSVTAECVESAEQAKRLRAIGCDTAQGWYYARPGPAELISALLRAAVPLPARASTSPSR